MSSTGGYTVLLEGLVFVLLLNLILKNGDRVCPLRDLECMVSEEKNGFDYCCHPDTDSNTM
jgi:hypothetical protein